MTKRFTSAGGTLLEFVAGKAVERDPFELRALAETWGRDGLDLAQRGDRRRAALYATNAQEALWALSAWREQKRAACGVDPFAETEGFVPFSKLERA